ncbi:MAG TPA: 4Fe-4S dicluster domain-containing protein [Firmicutes bacterium]|nr:4Fe-4S dicluster domain-containing protein [Bacillota bacterium]
MKLPGILQPTLLKEALSALFTGPYTLPFPKEPSEPHKRFRGKPKFDEDECVGCGACAMVCPANDITVFDDVKNGKRVITLYYDKCIQCGQCEANCITGKGIKLSREYDMIYFDRSQAKTSIEKELVLCEICGDVISTVDHIRWVARKLGPLAFSNPTLVLTALKDAKVLEEVPPRDKELEPGRYDVVRMLCAKCRRKVQLGA